MYSTAPTVSHEAWVRASPIRAGPSSVSDRSNRGTGATRLSHETIASMSTAPTRRSRTLPIAQKTAEPKVSVNPAPVTPFAPTVVAISTSPARVTAAPTIWRDVGRSRSTTAAMPMVMNA